MALLTHYVTVSAQYNNTDALPSNIAQTLMDMLTGTHSTRGVNPVLVPSFSPPANCPACNVLPNLDGINNIIYLQLITDDSTTDDQIVTQVTKAFVALAQKNPFTGTVFGTIGTVTILGVTVN